MKRSALDDTAVFDRLRIVVVDLDEGSDGVATSIPADATVLDDTMAFVRRYVSLSDAQAVAVTLWIPHSHTFEIYDGSTPYLHISSPEKQCGKTRLLEALYLLTRNPWLTGRATAAALVRKIHADSPTLLLDESDQALKTGDEYAVALTGVLNNGYRPGMPYTLCVGQGAKISYQDFNVFCAKAIAGIGTLPDTVMDRSIPIRMERQSGHRAEKFRRRDVAPIAQALYLRITKWAHRRQSDWLAARPEFPYGLSDRQEDVIEPLLAIADDAGGKWPQLARQSLIELFAGAKDDSLSIRTRLLSDIRVVLAEQLWKRVPSEDLTKALADIETSPWSGWNKGKPITPNGLARLLKPFKVQPRTIRIGAGTIKGYDRDFFTDAWARYLPPDGSMPAYPEVEPSQPSQPACLLVETDFLQPSQDAGVTVAKSASNPHEHCIVTDVTVQNRNTGEKATRTLPSCPACGSTALYRENGALVCESCRTNRGLTL